MEMIPYNIEAESSLLGSVLMSNTAETMDEVTSLISPDDFYRTAHKDIYLSI